MIITLTALCLFFYFLGMFFYCVIFLDRENIKLKNIPEIILYPLLMWFIKR